MASLDLDPDTYTPSLNDDGSYTPPEDEGVDSPGDASEDNPIVTENEDGSATIKDTPDEEEKPDVEDFYDNLVETVIPRDVLAEIAMDLDHLIERDRESRKKRDEDYAEGIRRTGLGGEAPGGAEFEGASRAVHPVLTEGCIDFASKCIKEIFPPKGPVKTTIIGPPTQAKLEKANRKRQYLNWYMTTKMSEYRPELERGLSQEPLAGNFYQKFWWDTRKKRVRTEVVFIDDIYLPYDCHDFYSTPRMTHHRRISREVFNEQLDSGEYKKTRAPSDPATTDQLSDAAKAREKVEGKEEVSFNEDGTRDVHDVFVNWDFTEYDTKAKFKSSPYVITIDVIDNEIISVRRNWDDEDEDQQARLDWYVEFGFIPWSGAYHLGLPHIVGSLSTALTGGIRAILDSAHINNFPGGIKLKGARVVGQSTMVEPTQFAEIDSSAVIDDIRKVAMPFPFNPPSTVLFEMVQWLQEQARGVVATAEEAIKGATSEMPVGTAMSLIEQGSNVFAAIHARQHYSQARALQIVHRLLSKYMDDEDTVEELGDLVIQKSDFEGPMDVIPVSDPNIFSEAQRYAQFQSILQLSADQRFMQFNDNAKLYRRGLELLSVGDYEEFTNFPPIPQKLDPVTENMMVMLQKQPVQVFPDQDHLAHIAEHLSFAANPMYCANPITGPTAVPAMLQHVFEHLAYYYGQHTLAATSAAHEQAGVQGQQIEGMIPGASKVAQEQIQKSMTTYMPQLQQLLKLSGQFQQSAAQAPLQDPNAEATRQVGMAEVKRKQAADQANQTAKQGDQQIKQQQVAQAGQKDQAETALAQQEQQTTASLEQAKLMLDKMRDQAKNFLDMMAAETDRMRLTHEALQTHLGHVETQTGHAANVAAAAAAPPPAAPTGV
jgi:hypothetical protein